MQIKTTIRLHYLPIQIAEKKKVRKHQELARIGSNENSYRLMDGVKILHINLKSHFSVFTKAEHIHEL